MRRTGVQRMLSGLACMAGLAALAWGGLGLSQVRGTPRAVDEPPAVTASRDSTPPTGLRVEGGPNADGWYAAPARFRWTAEDSDGGIIWCQGGSVVAVDSPVPRSVYGTCANGEGMAPPYVGFSYRYDGTPPRLHPVALPAVVARFGVVVGVPHATDALSGVDHQSCNGGRLPSTRRVGTHTLTCYAGDRAGNLTVATVSYLVVDRRLRD